MLDNLDFTLNKYIKLCKSITSSKYIAVPLSEYLKEPKYTDHHIIIMRHDIDQNCRYALDLARVEHEYNIKASYYFRITKATYIADILDEIASYGHEIGYHYETVDKCKGNVEMAKSLFKKELTSFRSRYEIKTVCAHGNPLTKFDNKDIWKNLNFQDFGLLGEAFLSLDYSRFAYFSDSGRTWLNNRSQKMPGKDSVETAFKEIQPKSTNDVIKIIGEGKLPNICILTHPERWNKDLTAFTRRYLIDLVLTWGKIAIYTFRRN